MDWPIDDDYEDREAHESEEESWDESENESENESTDESYNETDEECKDNSEPENDTEQIKPEEKPKEVFNANTLSDSQSKTSPTKSPPDHQRSDPPSSNPRVPGEDVFATGQHHIWI